jgi:hypothetical protein
LASLAFVIASAALVGIRAPKSVFVLTHSLSIALSIVFSIAGEEFAKKGDQTEAGLKKLKDQLGGGEGAPAAPASA